MKKSKLKDYLSIISVPVILIAITIFLLVYNYFTGKIAKFIPNLYGLSAIIVFICVSFMFYNIRDYKKGKL